MVLALDTGQLRSHMTRLESLRSEVQSLVSELRSATGALASRGDVPGVAQVQSARIQGIGRVLRRGGRRSSGTSAGRSRGVSGSGARSWA